MLHATNIRATIAANQVELTLYGSLPVARVNAGKPGRPSSGYLLNEGQALVLCALARTAKAVEVRKGLIDLFTAYRAGKVVDVKEHRRAKPSVRRAEDYDSAYERHLWFVKLYRGNTDAMESIVAGILARLDTMAS